MKHGRELDALIAEKVMGLGLGCTHEYVSAVGEGTQMKCDACGQMFGQTTLAMSRGRLPRYSTDISSAWEVVEWMARGKWQLQLTAVSTDDDNHWWEAEFFAREHLQKGFGDAKAAPLAICLAALQGVSEGSPTQEGPK